MALTDSLIWYWELDEASGTRFDSHGTNHLTDNNTVGSTTGIVGNAASFAATEYLDSTSNASLQTGDIDFTVAAWINHPNANGDRTFVFKGSEWFIYTSAGTVDANIGGTAFGSSFGFIGFGVWRFVVLWHDSVNNVRGLSVDGVEDTESYSGGTTADAGGFALSYADAWADGQIDQVGFWKRVLTSGERSQLFNGGAGLAYAALGGGAPNTSALPQNLKFRNRLRPGIFKPGIAR